MINVRLNKKLDYNTYETFKTLCFAGLDFGEEIHRLYPDLSPDNYKVFIDKYYRAHKTEILSAQKGLITQIEEKVNDFFAAIYGIFGKDYSQKNYTGYLSIFYCNPRYLRDNSFQIYYKLEDNELLKTIFHETLHLIFFDYCKTNIPETKKLDCNSGPLWELSEIFNILVLNSKSFQQILPVKHEFCYPALSEKYISIEKIWQENLPVNQFMGKSLEKLSKKKLI